MECQHSFGAIKFYQLNEPEDKQTRKSREFLSSHKEQDMLAGPKNFTEIVFGDDGEIERKRKRHVIKMKHVKTYT